MGNTWEVIEKQGRLKRCSIPQNDSLTNRKLQSLGSPSSCLVLAKAPIIKWQSCSRYFVASASNIWEIPQNRCKSIVKTHNFHRTWFFLGCVMENAINKAIMQRNHSREWTERLKRAAERNRFAAQLPHLAWYRTIMKMCKMLLNKVWITRDRYATESATIKITFPYPQASTQSVGDKTRYPLLIDGRLRFEL